MIPISARFSQTTIQAVQLMLTTGWTRLAVRGQQTWYCFGSIATFR